MSFSRGKALVTIYCYLYNCLILFVAKLFMFVVTSWTGYIMVLVAPGLYIMIDVGHTELPKSFQTCGQFINGIDNLFTFAVCMM